MKYYQPIMELIGKSNLLEQSQTEKLTFVEQEDFSIGIERELAGLLLKEDYIGADNYLSKNKETRKDSESIYKSDGICVQAGESWHKLLYEENIKW